MSIEWVLRVFIFEIFSRDISRGDHSPALLVEKFQHPGEMVDNHPLVLSLPMRTRKWDSAYFPLPGFPVWFRVLDDVGRGQDPVNAVLQHLPIMGTGQEANLFKGLEAEHSEWLGLRRTLPEDEHTFVSPSPSGRHLQRGGHLPAQRLELHDDDGDQIPGLDGLLAIRPPWMAGKFELPEAFLLLAVLDPPLPVLADHLLHRADDGVWAGSQPHPVLLVQADHHQLLLQIALKRLLVLEEKTVCGSLDVQVRHLEVFVKGRVHLENDHFFNGRVH